MLDDQATALKTRDDAVVGWWAKRARAAAGRSTLELDGLAIWLRWSGDAQALRAAVKPLAVAEAFTMVAATRDESGADLWVCAFHHAGRAADRDERILAFLRRLEATAQWLRVARLPIDPSRAAEDAAALTWDALGQRMLP